MNLKDLTLDQLEIVWKDRIDTLIALTTLDEVVSLQVWDTAHQRVRAAFAEFDRRVAVVR